MLTIDGQPPSEKLTPVDFDSLSPDVLLQIFASLPTENLDGMRAVSTAARCVADDEELWLDKLTSLIFEVSAGVAGHDRRIGESARLWYFRCYDFMHKMGIMAHLSMHGVLEGLEFKLHGGAYLTLPMDHGTLAELVQLGKKRGELNPAVWAAAFFGDSSERGDSLVWMIRNTDSTDSNGAWCRTIRAAQAGRASLQGLLSPRNAGKQC